jgi:hypothetical protein
MVFLVKIFSSGGGFHHKRPACVKGLPQGRRASFRRLGTGSSGDFFHRRAGQTGRACAVYPQHSENTRLVFQNRAGTVCAL